MINLIGIYLLNQAPYAYINNRQDNNNKNNDKEKKYKI